MLSGAYHRVQGDMSLVLNNTNRTDVQMQTPVMYYIFGAIFIRIILLLFSDCVGC